MHSPHLERRFGLLHATALNMSNMVGIGPFITIPLIIATMGGPQCMLGWLVGVFIAISDGMVWAELSSAMPGSGGTYVYLKRAFEKLRFGRAMPFLFVWQFILSGPLEVASGTIGISKYMNYFWKSMSSHRAACNYPAVSPDLFCCAGDRHLVGRDDPDCSLGHPVGDLQLFPFARV